MALSGVDMDVGGVPALAPLIALLARVEYDATLAAGNHSSSGAVPVALELAALDACGRAFHRGVLLFVSLLATLGAAERRVSGADLRWDTSARVWVDDSDARDGELNAGVSLAQLLPFVSCAGPERSSAGLISQQLLAATAAGAAVVDESRAGGLPLVAQKAIAIDGFVPPEEATPARPVALALQLRRLGVLPLDADTRTMVGRVRDVCVRALEWLVCEHAALAVGATAAARGAGRSPLPARAARRVLEQGLTFFPRSAPLLRAYLAHQLGARSAGAVRAQAFLASLGEGSAAGARWLLFLQALLLVRGGEADAETEALLPHRATLLHIKRLLERLARRGHVGPASLQCTFGAAADSDTPSQQGPCAPLLWRLLMRVELMLGATPRRAADATLARGPVWDASGGARSAATALARGATHCPLDASLWKDAAETGVATAASAAEGARVRGVTLTGRLEG